MNETQNLRDLIDASMAEHPQHARLADIELDELNKTIERLESQIGTMANRFIHEYGGKIRALEADALALAALRSENANLAMRNEALDKENARVCEELRQAREALEKAHNQAARSKCLNCSEVFYILEATLRSPAASEPVPQIICTCGKPIASCKCKEPVPQDEKESK